MKSTGLIFLCAVVTLAVCTTDLNAQKNGYRDRLYFISLQGGASFSMNENFDAFILEKRAGELFCPQGSLSFGRYLKNGRYGFRLNLEYSQNRSAWNYQESFNKFKPYSFQSFAAFADALVNCGDVNKPKAFNCRVFLGLGYAYTFGFKKPQDAISWYEVTEKNHCFGIRAGIILEYVAARGFGVFLEPCFEMFTDKFNGVDPKKNGKKAGFPFDYKPNVSLGVAYHF
ncbi:MAG: DUF4249 domain-containing protein [Bacteroidales bacterium]|nr:DUF4249 domain-containing protein [Bacteroidales bacterium]